jgi:hypothetical protein
MLSLSHSSCSFSPLPTLSSSSSSTHLLSLHLPISSLFFSSPLSFQLPTHHLYPNSSAQKTAPYLLTYQSPNQSPSLPPSLPTYQPPTLTPLGRYPRYRSRERAWKDRRVKSRWVYGRGRERRGGRCKRERVIERGGWREGGRGWREEV